MLWVRVTPLDGELAVASHWVVMSWEAYLGLFGVVLLIAIAVLGGFQWSGGGGGGDGGSGGGSSCGGGCGGCGGGG